MPAQPLGKVFLVGAGPGDPELITLKGKRCLEAADVILFDELANHKLLEFAAPGAQLIYVGKKPGKWCADQREIEALLVKHALAGQYVVRLKGGDPFIFGRGGEEVMALSAAGIPFEVVPGVSSALAVPAYAGIPVTHRNLASSFAVVTGHKVGGDEVLWGELARSVSTLVILMGLANLKAIMKKLRAEGCDPKRSVALIQSGTTKKQRVLRGTVKSISSLASSAGFRAPAVIVVGEVVRQFATIDWFGDDTNSPRMGDSDGIPNIYEYSM